MCLSAHIRLLDKRCWSRSEERWSRSEGFWGRKEGLGSLLTDEVGLGASRRERNRGFSDGGGVDAVLDWEGVGGCGEGESDDGGELHFCCVEFWVGEMV